MVALECKFSSDCHLKQDDIIDVIPMAFLNVFFGEGNEPSLDLANVSSILDFAILSKLKV